MHHSARFFALLGIAAISGCATGSPRSGVLSPFVPQSAVERGPAAPSRPTVFVAVDSANAIESFPGGVVNPKIHIAITTGINNPTGIAVGGSGTLFVNNSGNNTITEYPPGATKPSFTLNLAQPINLQIAAGPDDTLYVEDGNFNIDVYPKGATQPSAILPNPGGQGPQYGLGAIAVDKDSNIFVSAGGGACCGIAIFEYPNASPNSFPIKNSTNMAGGVAIGGSGVIFSSPGIVLRKPFIHVIFPTGKILNFPAPHCELISYDAQDQYLYTSSATWTANGSISIVDYKTRRLLTTLPGITTAYGVAVRPATF